MSEADLVMSSAYWREHVTGFIMQMSASAQIKKHPDNASNRVRVDPEVLHILQGVGLKLAQFFPDSLVPRKA